jgi:ATP-dependent DNA helicase UvrD/PcrA
MIEPHEQAPEGSVTTLHEWSHTIIGPTDAVLCRNTAPLVALAFSFLRQHKRCRVLGKDIGAGLAALVKKMKASSIDLLEMKLEKHLYVKKSELIEKGKDAQAANLEDKISCIMLFAENCNSVAEILTTIEELFSDKNNCTVLSTVHKSKGLEFPRVFILDSFLMPSKWAIQTWQKQQETNLAYVAVTRAKLDLVYITSDGQV